MKSIYSIFLVFCLTGSWSLIAQKSYLTDTQYRGLLEKHFDVNGPGASILVAKKGKIVYKNAIGYANLEQKTPMTAEHVHRIGSITKQFTAVATLMLMEDKKLDLQDELTKFIPDYPTRGHRITVEHLLTHTSGIKSMTDMPGFFDHSRKHMTTDEMLDYFKNEPMDFKPGEAYRYNNSGYYLLGVIIEKVSGMSYADFIQKRIFDKVGMKNSYYDNARQIIPMRASGYDKENNQYGNAAYLDMSLPYAAGSLLSTVEDWLMWNQALQKHELIQEATLQQAFTPYRLNNGEATTYGYGWGISELFGSPMIEHSGGINGFLTQGIYLPKEDVYVVIYSNCNCQPPGDLAKMLAAMEIGKYIAKEKINVSPEQLNEYVGVYQVNGQNSKRTFRVEGDHLTSQRSGGDLYHIYPYEKDRFFFENDLTVFEFKRDAAGKITGMAAIRANGKNDTAQLTKEAPVVRKEVNIASSILERYSGEYEMMPGFNIIITVEDGKLMGQPSGQSKLQLFALSETSFFLKVVDAQVEFAKDDQGNFSLMKLNQGGQELVGKKK